MSIAQTVRESGEQMPVPEPENPHQKSIANPEQSREVTLYLFVASTTERQDISEQMFEGDPVVSGLKNKTEPAPIVLDVLKKLYKGLYKPEDLAEVKEFVDARYDTYKEMTEGNPSLMRYVDEVVATHHQDNDLRRGFAAFREQANQYHNYAYDQTSLEQADHFCNFLTSGDII